jgi:aspartate-semialdehyde dehydrogenase
MNPLVPLIVPVANSNHFDIIQHQRREFKKTNGFLVTNANCSTTGLVVALKALQDKFGPLSKVVVTTMQAISGAGYPGVPSLDILGNVVPYISGEEPKLETEACKILGSISATKTTIEFLQNMKISASCNRVPVIEGHTESVFVEFENRPAPSVEQVKECFRTYTCEAQQLKCFSTPENCIFVSDEPDRPQPRLDALLANGNGIVVGGIRPCNVFDVKFNLLVHNTILGAAGSSIMNAEIALAKKLI